MGNDFKDLFAFGDGMSNNEGYKGSIGDAEPENRVKRIIKEREVKIVDVFEGYYETRDGNTMPGSTTFVLLQDNYGRKLRVFVLKEIAYAISIALNRNTPERPFTHDLMKTIVEKMGGKVDRVIIDDLWKDTFYAKILISLSNHSMIDIDARPSDALALAVRCRVPIYVAEDVLEQAQYEE